MMAANMTIHQLQPHLVNHFAKVLAAKRLAHAYLFCGSAGVGKNQLAHLIAASLLCSHPQPNGLACLQCNNCKRVLADEHPDVVVIKPEGRQIKVDQIRLLQAEFTKSAVESAHKVFIIGDAEKMTASAANSLLKFLEEPSANITALLLSSQPSLLLPTVVSRCQMFELPRLPFEKIVAKLTTHGIKKSQANVLAALSDDIAWAINQHDNQQFWQQVAAIVRWYEAVIKNDMMSFVQVASQIMPQTPDYPAQKICLDLVVLLSKDAMLSQVLPDYSPVFFDVIEKNAALLNQIGPSKLAQGVNECLATGQLHKQNIAFENILETLTLKMLSCYYPHE